MDKVYSDGFLTELVLSTVIFLLVFKLLPLEQKILQLNLGLIKSRNYSSQYF